MTQTCVHGTGCDTVTTVYRWGLLAISLCCLVFSYHRSLTNVRRILWLAAIYAFVRTALFSLTFATDTRYLVEAMPALETAAVLAGATLLLGRRGRVFQPFTVGWPRSGTDRSIWLRDPWPRRRNHNPTVVAR